MSGLAAVVGRDAGEPDQAHFTRWTTALSPGGAPCCVQWSSGPAALALCDEGEAGGRLSHHRDPLSGVSVLADARLDALDDLCAALGGAPDGFAGELNDARLIAAAYDRWGERCPERLHGDFAFVIWDPRRLRLLAARDRYGVRQLYHAETAHGPIISTSARALYRHPWVSRRLDDQAVVDYLVHDQVAHAATLFEDVRRLEAGHVLSWSGSLSIRRYWTLEEGPPIRFRRAGEYPRMLRELLETAISDRARDGRACVLLSGGVDSTAVLAAACGELPDRARIRTCTASSAVRMPDAPQASRYVRRRHSA